MTLATITTIVINIALGVAFLMAFVGLCALLGSGDTVDERVEDGFFKLAICAAILAFSGLVGNSLRFIFGVLFR